MLTNSNYDKIVFSVNLLSGRAAQWGTAVIENEILSAHFDFFKDELRQPFRVRWWLRFSPYIRGPHRLHILAAYSGNGSLH